MVLTTRLYTAEDLWQLPGDEPWELWDGELRRVPPAGAWPTTIASIINFHLRLYLRDNNLGTVSSADGGYILFRRDGRDTVVAPDVGFVRWDRLPGGTLPPRGFFPIPPDLAVEVAADVVYGLLNEEVFQLFTTDCGWDVERFRQWATSLLRQQLLVGLGARL